MNRRDLLKGAALASVAAVVPVAAIAQIDRCEWDQAVAHLEQATAEYARAAKAHDEAEDAAERACPHLGSKHLNRYGLSCVGSREENLRNAHIAVVNELVREKGRPLTSVFDEGDACEAKAANLEAERIVDEFYAWQDATDGAEKKYRTRELEAEYEADLERREQARASLFATPAPDQDALLFKIELLASILDELEDEDASSLDKVLFDARRLLNVGRA